MPPCRLKRRKFRKFDYEMAHSEIHLNKYVVSIAPFSTPACPDCSQNSALDSGAERPGFKSQPRCCRLTILGKLFTPIVPLFTKQQNWQQPS